MSPTKKIEVRYEHGLLLPEIDFWLDPPRAKERAFVSHAHADHYARHRTIVCSQPTRALIEKRYGRPKHATFVALEYGEPYTLTDDVVLELFPAGHVLGSAQCHLKRLSDGASLLYSGDFKLRRSAAAEAIEIPKAQTLIMETTFSTPQYRFPPREQIIGDVLRFCRHTLEQGQTPILLAYSLGKAQEILALLRESQLPMMLHPTVAEMTEVYRTYLDVFPAYAILGKGKVNGHVVIAPPTTARSQDLRRLGSTRLAMLSGWAAQRDASYRFGAHAVFPLSDHADYADSLRYVEQVEPELVYTLHGYAADFAADLRQRGRPAWSVIDDNQLALGLTLTDAERASVPETQSDEVVAFKNASNTIEALRQVEKSLLRALGSCQMRSPELISYFQGLEPEDLRRALCWLTGNFPATPAEPLKRLRSRRALATQLAQALTGWSTAQFRKKLFTPIIRFSSLVLALGPGY